MVRWVAGYHVVNSPIVTLKVFTTSSAYWFKYGLSVGSSLYPFFTAMPVSHCSHYMMDSMVALVVVLGSIHCHRLDHI